MHGRANFLSIQIGPLPLFLKYGHPLAIRQQLIFPFFHSGPTMASRIQPTHAPIGPRAQDEGLVGLECLVAEMDVLDQQPELHFTSDSSSVSSHDSDSLSMNTRNSLPTDQHL